MQCKATLRSACIVCPPAIDSTSMPPGRVSYSITPATNSMSMPQGLVSYSVTPASYSMSMTPG
eukprot:1474664-Rhodomonas_salina.1